MPPYQGGGDMIKLVTFERTTYNELPYKFEAGTPHIAGAVGLAAGLDYLAGLGLDRVDAYEHALLRHGTELLTAIRGVRLIGTARRKAAVLSFVLDGVHAHDLGTILDQHGVAIRAGHHCAMPVMQRFGVPATARASLAFYNTHAELETLATAVERAREILA
jgi:cysteine desulfurase/selenocysteine lyase